VRVLFCLNIDRIDRITPVSECDENTNRAVVMVSAHDEYVCMRVLMNVRFDTPRVEDGRQMQTMERMVM
jgi:hypothetical protein